MSIEVMNVNFSYSSGLTNVRALDDVSVSVEEGEFIGLIGRTGSGKSTLIQLFNGLLVPTSGKVLIDGDDISAKTTDLKKIRQKVGLVFQYPEYQLFEETVSADVAFGPRNYGVDGDELNERVAWALGCVGMDAEEFGSKSPFELSGGEKRRVAIAGVLAMKPKYLVLDEPTAGLDPRGRDALLNQLKKLHSVDGLTVILVSHNMEEIAEIVTRLIVMGDGKIVMDGPVREIFRESDRLKSIGLGIPQVSELMSRLRGMGYGVSPDVLTVSEAEKELLRFIRGDVSC